MVKFIELEKLKFWNSEIEDYIEKKKDFQSEIKIAKENL